MRLTKRTFMRVVLLAVVVSSVAYMILSAGVDDKIAAQPVVSIAAVQPEPPAFSSLLSCDHARWYNAPLGNGQRSYVPNYDATQAGAGTWRDMTDDERGDFLGACGKDRP